MLELCFWLIIFCIFFLYNVVYNYRLWFELFFNFLVFVFLFLDVGELISIILFIFFCMLVLMGLMFLKDMKGVVLGFLVFVGDVRFICLGFVILFFVMFLNGLFFLFEDNEVVEVKGLWEM